MYIYTHTHTGDRGTGRQHPARRRRGLLPWRCLGCGLPLHRQDALYLQCRWHWLDQGSFWHSPRRNGKLNTIRTSSRRWRRPCTTVTNDPHTSLQHFLERKVFWNRMCSGTECVTISCAVCALRYRRKPYSSSEWCRLREIKEGQPAWVSSVRIS